MKAALFCGLMVGISLGLVVSSILQKPPACSTVTTQPELVFNQGGVDVYRFVDRCQIVYVSIPQGATK